MVTVRLIDAPDLDRNNFWKFEVPSKESFSISVPEWTNWVPGSVDIILFKFLPATQLKILPVYAPVLLLSEFIIGILQKNRCLKNYSSISGYQWSWSESVLLSPSIFNRLAGIRRLVSSFKYSTFSFLPRILHLICRFSPPEMQTPSIFQKVKVPPPIIRCCSPSHNQYILRQRSKYGAGNVYLSWIVQCFIKATDSHWNIPFQLYILPYNWYIIYH